MPLSNASTDFVTNVIVKKIANVPFIASESEHIRVAGLQNKQCVGVGCWQGHSSIIRLLYTTIGGS